MLCVHGVHVGDIHRLPPHRIRGLIATKEQELETLAVTQQEQLDGRGPCCPPPTTLLFADAFLPSFLPVTSAAAAAAGNRHDTHHTLHHKFIILLLFPGRVHGYSFTPSCSGILPAVSWPRRTAMHATELKNEKLKGLLRAESAALDGSQRLKRESEQHMTEVLASYKT